MGTAQHTCRGCGRMILMYEDGHSALRIAHELHTAPATVYRSLRAHEVTIRPQGNRGQPTAPWRREALDLYHQGYSAAAIGLKIARTRERVRQVLIGELGDQYRPHRHHCTEMCAAVLASSGEPFVAIAQRLGVSWSRISRAAHAHGIDGGRRHRCNERCAAVRAALDTETTPRQMILATFGRHWSKGHVAIYLANTKTYHPDWPWYDGRTRGAVSRQAARPRHLCGDRCRTLQSALSVHGAPAGALRTAYGMTTNAAHQFIYRMKQHHPDWLWPTRAGAVARALHMGGEAYA